MPKGREDCSACPQASSAALDIIKNPQKKVSIQQYIKCDFKDYEGAYETGIGVGFWAFIAQVVTWSIVGIVDLPEPQPGWDLIVFVLLLNCVIFQLLFYAEAAA